MSHTLHLVKKDLRALRLPLLVFYGLVAVQAAIALRDPLTHESIPDTSTMILLIPLAVLIIAGMVIQQEPLVGTSAFWMTRPIPRGTLLLSKALFVLVFVVAPSALVTLGIMAAYGMEPGRLGSGVALSLTVLVVLVLSAMAVASVAPNMPVYVTAWIGILLANQLLHMLLAQVTNLGRVEVSRSSTLVIDTTVFLVASVPVILHQYLTLRTRRTLIGIAIAMTLIPLGERVVSRKWSEYAMGTAAPASVVLDLNPTQGDGPFLTVMRPHFDTTFVGEVQALETPPGVDLTIRNVQAKLVQSGQEYARVDARNVPIDVARGGVEAAMSGFRWMGTPRSVVILGLNLGSDSTLDGLAGGPVNLQGVVRGELRTYRLAGTIPLARGARFEDGSMAAVVESVSPRSSMVQLILKTRYIVVIDESEFPRILLINRRRGEMVEGDSMERRSEGQIFGFAGPIVRGRDLEMGFPVSTQRASVVLDAQWLRDAELAFLESVPVGEFETEIDVPDFRLAERIGGSGDSSALTTQ